MCRLYLHTCHSGVTLSKRVRRILDVFSKLRRTIGVCSLSGAVYLLSHAAPTSLEFALKSLQKEIHLYIAEHAQHHVFIHAGVVVLKNRVIVFPGFSHAGKSTLVWSFVQAGAIYYSDEYAVFDKEGFLHPFALPIGLRLDDGNKQLIMPDNIGTSQRKPDFIVFARYRPGAIWHPIFS